MKDDWRVIELCWLILYALCFYAFVISRSLKISQDHHDKLYGLRYGWIFPSSLNDQSDAQWRNFRANIPMLAMFFGLVTLLVNSLRVFTPLRAKALSIFWLFVSLCYLYYLHGVCTLFILMIASLNFILVKILASSNYFSFFLWTFNITFLLCNRIYEGYPFALFGQRWAHLDNFRGTFRWHICFNFVILRMISFGYDFRWADQNLRFNLKDRRLPKECYSFSIYLSYLVYAPLYIAGPIVSFNSYASQLNATTNATTIQKVFWYGIRWIFCFCLIELMTHLFHYNAFAISGLWKLLSPVDIFIIGYGVLNFMWLKFLLIWRFFLFWSLLCGVEAPENMPRCINNCYNLENFWKNWHASYNKWLVRYMYIPLGGSQRKLLNVWVIFTFVAIWHDLEWKLLSWAWLTCLFFVPEMLVKSATGSYQMESAVSKFMFRELRAFAGSITITCLMVANLVGYVIGPSGINWLFSRFLTKDGMPTLAAMLLSFYVGAKLMFHIEESRPKQESARS